MAEYIDKEAFIAFIDRGHLRAPWKPCFTENDVVEMVKAFPAADVRENDKGEWRLSSDHAEGVCTVCNFKIYGTPYNGHYFIVPYNFCPNCGADMREVTE
jgi:hypothetical protein